MEYSTDNSQLKLAYDFIESTSQNLFLTGKAGTGKTTFLKELKQKSPKRIVVVAPTGVAAINAGGVTIHSFFQLSFGPQIPRQYSAEYSEYSVNLSRRDEVFTRVSRDKKNIIRSLDLLIIDEISMVRADLLDAIDGVLRRYRNQNLPFGGVQMLMIGDLQQLAPVTKADEWQVLNKYYDSPFFFSSKAIQEAGFISLELKKIYRQSDQNFIDLLNKIRENKPDSEAIQQLNERYIPGFSPADEEGYITLTTHNAQAKTINEKKLAEIKSSVYKYAADIIGDFPEYSYPTEEFLALKLGAQVMFVKNDISPEKLYYNGKIGRIESIEDDVISVICEGDDFAIPVEKATWQNMKYSVNENTQEIEEVPIGSFSQLPLKLAWAITIHKSQGLTFDKAVIDANAAFAHGQVYVALSRCRSLEGLILSSKVSDRGIISNAGIKSFTEQIEENEPDNDFLIRSQIDYQHKLLNDLFDFTLFLRRINYCIKIATSNAESLLGDPVIHLQEVAKSIQERMISVAKSFFIQLNQGESINQLVEDNAALQIRIKKGCTYFLNILNNEIIPAFDLVHFETDNKAVKKSLANAASQIEEQLEVKMASLASCEHGFSVVRFLEARAKASLVKAPISKSAKLDTNIAPANIAYPEVFQKLKSWRAGIAKKQALAHYMILSQKAIAGLAHYLPASFDEMKKIKGIGKRTLEKYGEDILEIILSFREDNKIDIKMPESERKPAKEKLKKRPTREISLELFQSGKSVDEIAEERGLTSNTIESHLAHYVGEGLLDIEQFVDEKKLALIAEYFQKSKSLQLNDAKHALGDEVSYSDLRFVLNYMRHTGQVEG